MSDGEEKSESHRFVFGFNAGFDLYVAVRCGKKEAWKKLEKKTLEKEEIFAAGYLAMSLTRSEHSTIPKDIPRAKELSRGFLPPILELVQSGRTEWLSDAFYLAAFCYQEGK
jgi:hypothetical protein